MIKIFVQKTMAEAEKDAPITSGSVGLEAQFYFSSDWDGLTKEAVFETSYGYKETKTIPTDGIVEVPENAMALHDVKLFIGVQGENNEGEIVVPTIYADCGNIKRGANTDPNDVELPPTQMQVLVNRIEEVERRANEGEFDGEDGDDGGYYAPNVNQVDEETVRVSFTPSAEGMSAVLPTEVKLPRGKDGSVKFEDLTPEQKEEVKGDPGGYYTPRVSQEDANTMNVSFAASQSGMEQIAEQRITLPAGAKGEPGITPHIGANGTWYIGTTDTGVKAAGTAGKGIASISRTKGDGSPGTTDTYTITYTDNTTATYGVYNGKDGAPGASPVRGEDYWTPEDQEAIVAQVTKDVVTEEMIQRVIAVLGTPVFGRVDENNNITITGELAVGTYTLKYEDEDGIVSDIGTLTVLGNIVNLADPTSADWLTDQRFNSSLGITAQTGSYITNYIPCAAGDVVRVRGLDIAYYAAGTRSRFCLYSEDGDTVYESLVPADGGNAVNSGITWTYTVGEGCTNDTSTIQYIRFCGMLYSGYTANDVIITVNQEIK